MKTFLGVMLTLALSVSNIHYPKVQLDMLNSATLIQLSPYENEVRMMGYVIITNLGKLIVIDGGEYEDGPNLQKYIEQNGGQVDAWFITHYHGDHTGAFNYIVNNTNIEINKVYQSLSSRDKVLKYEKNRLSDYDKYFSSLTSNKLNGKVEEVKLGEVIEVGNVKFEILGVKNEEITYNFGNNQSVVIKTYIGKSTVLFLGDTGVESEKKLIKYFKDKLDCDYVQMAHHGQGGVSEDFYRLVNPKYCLWPASDIVFNNDFGKGFNSGNLKTIETRNWMLRLGVTNYVAKDGDIILNIY